MIFAEAVTELEQYDRFKAGGRGAHPRQHDRKFGKTELFD